MPPACRKPSPREVFGFLRARGQFGFPASLRADACLGFRATGYQSWEVARGHCEVLRPLSQLDLLQRGMTPRRKPCPGGQRWDIVLPARRRRTSPIRPLSNWVQSARLKRSACLWATDGPPGGRPSAAVTYSLDANGAAFAAGWDWAALSLDFVAPKPLFRSISNDIPVRMPKIAEAEKKNRRAKEDFDLRATSDAPEARPLNMDDQPIPENSPLTPDDLISATSDRVRLDKYTRLPLTPSARGASKTSQLSGTQRFRMWKGKGKGRGTTEPQPARPLGGYRNVLTPESQPERPRGGHRFAGETESRNSESSLELSSSWSPRRHNWSEEKQHRVGGYVVRSNNSFYLLVFLLCRLPYLPTSIATSPSVRPPPHFCEFEITAYSFFLSMRVQKYV